MRRTINHLTLLFIGLAILGCGGPRVDRPEGGFHLDDDTPAILLPPPQLEPVADRIPYAVATLRGTTRGRRVIVEGVPNPLATTTLPDGSYCIDVPLPKSGAYEFVLFAQALDGTLSAPSAPIRIERDPTAPAIIGAQTCSGTDPAGCVSGVEICANDRDDDCNSLIDLRDPACSLCTDDALEPNDDPGSPRIDPVRHDGLMICPHNPDYFGIAMFPGETLRSHILFTHAEGDLDLHLLAAGTHQVLARSTSLSDDELITFTATAANDYELHVFSDAGAANPYTLEVEIIPAPPGD